MKSIHHRAGLRLALACACVLSAGAWAQDGIRVRESVGGRREVAVTVGQDLGAVTTVLQAVSGEASNLRLQSIGSSRSVVATWTLTEGGETTAWYSQSIDHGVTWLDARPTDFELRLRYARFDPLQGTPSIPTALSAAPTQRLWIVQYIAPGLPAMRDEIMELGGTPLAYLANHADVIDLSPARVSEVRALPFVRWVGPYHPAYRMFPDDLAALQSGATPDGEPWNIVAVRGFDLSTKLRIADALARQGATPFFPVVKETSLLTLTMPRSALWAATQLDDVLWLDRWSPPEADMDIARQFTGANFLETSTPGAYTGQGLRGEVLDGGCDTSHVDLNTVLWHGTPGNLNHGTCTTGIVFGKGIGNAQARGMLPNAQGITGSYTANTLVNSNRFAYTQELLAAPYFATFQSNSWGSTLTTAYNSTSQQMDDIIFQLDFVILNSQSNAGTQSSRPQAWAKNIISVGGFYHQNTLTRAYDAWSGGASIGPAEDGSIKPDISNFYDNVFCTDQVGSAGYSTSDYYTGFNGTSAATPITAGATGLLIQMFADGVFGILKPGATVFDRRPHASTAKALLLATATQYPFSGTTADLTRVHQGWGTPQVDYAYTMATSGKFLCIDESAPLTVNQTATYTLSVAAGEPELRVTMVYPDPAGTTSATQHRINNVDLKVQSPSGVIYWGNNGLLAANYSTSGGTPNTLDTVENVRIQNPAAGAWTITVIAATINQDGNLATPGVMDVKFALVAVGGTPPPPGPPDSGQANSANARLVVNNSVNLNLQPAANGINGPFFCTAAAGGALTFTWSGLANQPVALAMGPLNRNNAVFPVTGSLDLGLHGAADLSDVSVIIDGLNPTGFLSVMGNTGPTGTRAISFTLPSLAPGVLGTFQAIVIGPGGIPVLTAASQVTLN